MTIKNKKKNGGTKASREKKKGPARREKRKNVREKGHRSAARRKGIAPWKNGTKKTKVKTIIVAEEYSNLNDIDRGEKCKLQTKNPKHTEKKKKTTQKQKRNGKRKKKRIKTQKQRSAIRGGKENRFSCDKAFECASLQLLTKNYNKGKKIKGGEPKKSKKRVQCGRK